MLILLSFLVFLVFIASWFGYWAVFYIYREAFCFY